MKIKLRRSFKGEIPPWVIKQDRAEKELKDKHPKIYREISEGFYELRNQNPYNTPQDCFNEIMNGRRIQYRVKKDFEDVFMTNFEQGFRNRGNALK